MTCCSGMVNKEEFAILLLMAAVGVSFCYPNDGPGIANNRSKIHITIDVESKGALKGNGKYKDIAKGIIKGIKVIDDGDKDDDDDDDDDDDVIESEESDNQQSTDRSKETHSVKKLADNETKSEKKKKSTNGRRSKKLNNRREKSARKEKKDKKTEGKAENLKQKKKRKKFHHNRRKKMGRGKQNDGIRKKGKNMKVNAKANDKKKLRIKEKKKGKFVPNPEGSPDPKDLKIPLTFIREDIDNKGNKSFENANQTNIMKMEGLNGNEESSNQDESNKNRIINAKADEGSQSNERNSNETIKQWKPTNKTRDFTKQIVLATLKEIKNMNNLTAENEIKNADNHVSNPLLERLVSIIN